MTNQKPTTAINYFAMPGIANDIEVAAQIWGTTPEAMHSRSRKRDVVDARNAVMWLRINRFNYSTTKAGAIFNRDHATAIHAQKAVENTVCKDFKNRLNQFKKAFLV